MGGTDFAVAFAVQEYEMNLPRRVSSSLQPPTIAASVWSFQSFSSIYGCCLSNDVLVFLNYVSLIYVNRCEWRRYETEPSETTGRLDWRLESAEFVLRKLIRLATCDAYVTCRRTGCKSKSYSHSFQGLPVVQRLYRLKVNTQYKVLVSILFRMTGLIHFIYMYI